MARVIPHPVEPTHPPGTIPIANRAYPGAGQLLSGRLEAWARALPPWRVAQGLFLFDIADAFNVSERRLLQAMEATGWWLSRPELGRGFTTYYPPWVPEHGRASEWHDW